jgi:hypothetical protein
MPCVHMRLISMTCVPSDPTLNIWRPDVDRGAPRRGKRWDSSLWTHGIVDLRREVPDGHAISVRNIIIHSGARQRSWAPGSRTRSTTHDFDQLWVPSEPQELSDHILSGVQATNYDRSDRWSNVTTDRGFIDDYPIIQVSPHWDPNNETWRINNQEAINSSSMYSTINRSMMIKFGSSSSSRTPLQPRLQHSPTAGANLWDKSGLTLQNWGALSDQQAMCHHLRRNLFKLNQ